MLLIPIAIWSASWLLDWEGEHDILESGVIAGLWAAGLSLLICAAFTAETLLAAFLAALGPALA